MKIIRSYLLAVFLLISSLTANAANLTYGQHYPQGNSAVDYIYGPNGMWKRINPAEYIWNYYSQYATPSHPYDRNALIAYANGTHFTTCRDANGHLLLDFNHNGELDVTDGGFSFHEHNGKGLNGDTRGNPFTQFWFDDNWLARFMSQAYARTQPNGLHDYTDFTRWRIIDGNTAYWTLYNSDFYDTLALDGLYYFSIANLNSALSKWDRMLTKSGAIWDSTNQRYRYPNILENYHMGLFKILTDQLMDAAGVTTTRNNQLIQHSVSLRSQILNNQEKNAAGTVLGWRSSITDTATLINTESISVNVLALNPKGKWGFEAGRSPLSQENKNYFLRPHYVLSAVGGLSQAGHMTYGPYWTFPTGSYSAHFFIRAPSPSGTVANLNIFDANSGQVLASRNVVAGDFLTGNQWTRIAVNFTTSNLNNSLEFRTYWNGGANIDVAWIKIK